MREPSSLIIYKLDFRSSKERIKTHLADKGKDSWDSYFPMGRYGYVEVSTPSSSSLYDMYVLNSYGVGSNKPINEVNPLAIPFHGEKGDFGTTTYSFSREPIIHSRYFGGIYSFFSEDVVRLSDFILPSCEENYKAWSTFIMQISR
jgi:hypothetical protein